jgi:subtilisin family serine protease
VALFTAAVLLLAVSASASASRFFGEEKVRNARVIEKASQGEAQDLIVVFEEADAVQRAASMRALSGAEHDTPDIMGEKSRIFRNKKEEALNALTADDAETLEDYDHLPVMFLRVKSKRALERLAAQPGVTGIYENRQFSLMLDQSLPLIGQPVVSHAGFTGSGTAVAVLDTGVDYTRAAFGNCTGNNEPADCLSLLPAPPGCRVACVKDFATNDNDLDDHGHGTNVSGIVSGVAPGTKVIGLDVFECVDSQCNPAPCNGSNFSACSDRIIDAINWTIANKAAYNIVALNMSLGGGGSEIPCDSDDFAVYIANAKSAGILSAVASGNNGFKNMLSSPACVPVAVSVGAVYDGGPNTPWNSEDRVTSFSNSADFLTLLAPGSYITAAGISMQGTSQATPHVAGAIAVLRSAFPLDTPSQIVSRMTASGIPVLDTRNEIIKPRIDLGTALNVTFGKVVSQDGFPVEGVTITLSGASSAVTTTDAEGKYTFYGLADGDYTITPSKGKVTFTPADRPITVNGFGVAVKSFTATVFSIAGKVRTASGQAVSGVTVTLGGDDSAIATTDGNGKYLFSGLGNGIYTVTPEKTGYSFTPSLKKTITVNGADKTGKNFTAITYAIKGFVRNAAGRPMPGVTISLSGDVTETRTTDEYGFYRFRNLPEGDYVVTPSKAGKTFEPTSRAVTLNGANADKQNFVKSP